MSQYFIMNITSAGSQINSNIPAHQISTEKVMSYEEKSVGSTAFYKCEACPYMALAEDDIKFHLFTFHPDLAKSNGLADNIQIQCPGCTNTFDAEESLRNHLRKHHKMGIKDIKIMIKSLVQIALKNATLKKDVKKPLHKSNDEQCIGKAKSPISIPQVIEIVPEVVTDKIETLPKGVAFISVDELQKMSTPNLETVDPKEIIQEASINIVYSKETSTQFVDITEEMTNNQAVGSTPDLISSIYSTINKSIVSPQNNKTDHSHKITSSPSEVSKEQCSVNKCVVKLKDIEKLKYHRKCHQNESFQCPECCKIYMAVDKLHSHLWKDHGVDMELPTCEICGYKCYREHRLINIHMKCHGETKAYPCKVCSKSFKNSNQLSKHACIHRKTNMSSCPICEIKFVNEQRLKRHIATVHEKLKPFKCSKCEHTTARKEEMVTHMRLHNGEKPYSCNQCSYRSADHNSMRRHKKIHSKEGVYKCKHCPYRAIQSTVFTKHMLTKHPDIKTDDVHCCSFCSFKTVSRDKYVTHLSIHKDTSEIKILIDSPKAVNKPSWTIPSDTVMKDAKTETINSQESIQTDRSITNSKQIEVYDCDTLPDNFHKTYSIAPEQNCDNNYSLHASNTDLSKENIDCISEGSNSNQYLSNVNFVNSHDNCFLKSTNSINENLLQNSVGALPNHLNLGNIVNTHMLNDFPVYLPNVSTNSNIMLKPVDRILAPMTKICGPIIKPSQILPVPSSSNSPVNISHDQDAMPRKKAKISVKSNLILKGPDQVNMFHSQQKMAFKRLEDNERFGLSDHVTFNNLITTQLMQLQSEAPLNESPNTMMTYPETEMIANQPQVPNDTSEIYPFEQEINVNPIPILSQQKVSTTNPSYIKLETTIKQNTQSPSLEKMCNANIMNNQALNQEYKASPPLEDLHKNMNIKNELKSDAFYNIALNNTATNTPILDQYVIDNLIGEQYTPHMDLSAAMLPDVADQQNDVIEIDDNSDDNKMMNRYDLNFPLESSYLMHNDFHFLECDMQTNLNSEAIGNDINRLEISIENENDMSTSDNCEHLLSVNKKDSMMNTPRPNTNKINVKNIELMKN